MLVVGDPILDEYVVGDCTRLSPEAPIPVLKVRDTRAVLGGAANTAANVAALGGQAVLVAAVGSDDAGRRLVEIARRRGVQCALATDNRPTSRKVRALGGQQQLLRLDYETDAVVDAPVAAAVLEQVRSQIEHASVVIVSDYAKGLVSADVCREILAVARTKSVPVVIDPRPQHADRYVGCDYLTPNWKEAQGLLGDVEGPASLAAVDDVGRRLAERFRANILLTLGAQGIRFFARDGRGSIDEPAQAREVFDVSGAGDTVVAAFALAIAAGAEVRDALRVANLAASVVVAKVGTATVSADELTRQTQGAERLVERAGLPGLVRELRERGKRIALATGVFSSIDPAQLAKLRDARRQADVLVVGIQAYAGSPAAAADVLLGLRDVDFVHVFEDRDALLQLVAPDVHVEGTSSHAGDGEA